MRRTQRLTVRGLAAIGALALMVGAGSAPALAAPAPEFSAPAVSAPTSVFPSTSKTKEYRVTAQVSGPDGFTY